MAELFTLPARATDSNGNNLSGAKLYFYKTGTTTPQSVYSNSGLTTPHANPVVADSGGKFAGIYLDPLLVYRAVLKTSDDVTTIYDLDPVGTGLGGSAGSGNVGFIQSGAGAIAETVQDALRRIIHQPQYSSYANAKTAAGNTKVLIASPQTNSGITGAKTRPGIVTGHMVIGDTDAVGLAPDAFVGLFADEKYSGNPSQEMRGISYTIRYNRQSPDQPTLGWDVIPVLGATVVGPENTQYIRGNMKSVVGELIFQKPTTGTYTVLTSHNWQAITYVEQNVTLTNWYGGIVNRPIYNGVSGGTITNGYGLLIDNLVGGGVTFTNIAAIKIDGVGNAGRIWWGDSAWITKDSSGKLEMSLNSQPMVLVNAVTSPSATAGAASALPATPSGYKHEIIGGVVRKFPYYEV